jgi:E3 ubiquitin-protein ligase DOA10
LLALSAPLLLAYLSEGVKKLLGINTVDPEQLVEIYLSTYPLFMIILLVITCVVFVVRAIDQWRDSVRDEIYLVGEVLHNLDDSER